MNKYFIIFLITLILAPFVYSATSSNILDVIPLNRTLTIDISANATCTSKFYANNGTTIFRNESLSYVMPGNIHDSKGIYKAKINCSDGTIYVKSYFVTKNGEPPASDTFTIFIYLLYIIAVCGLLYTFFNNIAKLITLEFNILNLLISWGFYFLLYVSVFMAQNYLINTLLEDLGVILITATAWTNIVLPVLLFVVSSLIIYSKGKKAKMRGDRDVN